MVLGHEDDAPTGGFPAVPSRRSSPSRCRASSPPRSLRPRRNVHRSTRGPHEGAFEAPIPSPRPLEPQPEPRTRAPRARRRASAPTYRTRSRRPSRHSARSARTPSMTSRTTSKRVRARGVRRQASRAGVVRRQAVRTRGVRRQAVRVLVRRQAVRVHRDDDKPYEPSSYDDKPYEQPAPFSAEPFDDVRDHAARGDRGLLGTRCLHLPRAGRDAAAQGVTAEDQAAENEFFASDDHPPMWDKVVAPSGPPPKPGKPSSGNLRLPDWMRDENGDDRPGRPRALPAAEPPCRSTRTRGIHGARCTSGSASWSRASSRPAASTS